MTHVIIGLQAVVCFFFSDLWGLQMPHESSTHDEVVTTTTREGLAAAGFGGSSTRTRIFLNGFDGKSKEQHRIDDNTNSDTDPLFNTAARYLRCPSAKESFYILIHLSIYSSIRLLAQVLYS